MALRFFKKDEKKEMLLLPDEQLVVLYTRSHNQEIIGILYERYTHLLFTVCFKYLGNEADAEDIVMRVFEKLFELLKISKVSNFKNWVYTITKNECLMQLRHRKSVERMKGENLRKLDEEIMETGMINHLIVGDSEQRIRYLEKAIDELNTEQKKCITLFFLDEKSYHEIELQTGYSYNEVKSHIQNGKRKLKIVLERMERYE